MKQTRVKICGVTREEDGVQAALQGAEFIGMIFAPSFRQISVQTAQKIISSSKAALNLSSSSTMEKMEKPNLKNYDFQLESDCIAWFSDSIKAAGEVLKRRPLFSGVFCNQSLEEILDVLEKVDLDIVQLHGDEPISMAKQIPVPVVKVFGVDKKFSPPPQINTPGFHNFVLLDTKVEGESERGGLGVSFDHSIAKAVSSQFHIDLIVAGGLTPENVASAINTAHPWCVDVSSGVESNIKGSKDHSKISAFIKNAKNC
ncbi:hypothetical protein BB560_002832 [Smittium megazygosporum]|uniref:N-(5'-phosphoribosyl)anthranilate isomerase n=1 Tax=Smittium megazygosporum TaxID=133381 RepID=A0A2T9ZDL9_9FUNG|nr:hypothetical protein BB560_002832 [Smittium megazygosporum]